MSRGDKSPRQRISREFDEIIKRIQVAKIKNGTANLRNKKTFSLRRITLAMTRHKDFDKMIRDIADTKLEDEK